MKRRGLVMVVAVAAVLLYLAGAEYFTRLGFPLDDSWIHQTYARNLAESGRWAYVPGVSSSGSTAPLWTLLLALGYLLRLPYLWWAYLLGAACLVWLAWAGMALWRALWPAAAQRDWLAGLVLVLTWPLVWAAVSGMETLLFIALGLTIVLLYVQQRPGREALLGLLCGLLILVRPDGLLLFLLVGVGLVWRRLRVRGGTETPTMNWGGVARFLGATLLPLIPYFSFNLAVSGEVWPNTFYAKQAEYAVLLARPLMTRFLSLLYLSLGGPPEGWQGIMAAHLLLLPGVVVAAWQAVRADLHERSLLRTLPLLWAGGHVFLYAWRLPVTYQHGRYLWAALPVWILFGLAGWRILLSRTRDWAASGRVLRLVATGSFALLLVIFLFLGAQAYATDVGFIEGEMVLTARWLEANTPPDAIIATHDIGAIGYFAQRPLLDLAGLISPEVVPHLADEAALADYVLNQPAEYLVAAPGWPYKQLTDRPDVHMLFNTRYAWTRIQGLNNMAVFTLP
jgi:hypothetical protein